MTFDRFCGQVLIHHGNDGNVNAHHSADARRPLTGGIDDTFGLDISLVGDDFCHLPGRGHVDIGDQHLGVDFNAHLSGQTRELESNPAGIYVPVIGHVNGPIQAIGSQLGTSFQDLLR